MIRRVILLLAAVVYLGSFDFVSSLTVQIEPKAEECFFEVIQGGTDVAFSYQVTRGGLLDIEVRVFDPFGNTLFSGLHFETKMKGRQGFVAQSTGAYKFCFNNEMSRFTAKVLSFSVAIGDKASSTSEPVKAEHLNPMENSISKVDRVLQSCIAEQKRIRIREQTHRDTAENTNQRVVWWSIAETAALLTMSIGQIWFLRRWFNVKQRV